MTTGGVGRRTSNYEVPLNVEQAHGTRDALAKVRNINFRANQYL